MKNGILQDLAALSQDLNDASDNLSQQIADFETALNKLRLGVRAWVVLKSWPSPAFGYSIDEGVSIGYGKHNGKWGLLYSEWNDIFPEETRVQLLREAPREDRLAAVEKLPELVRKLEEESRKFAEDARVKAAQMKEMVGALRALTQ